MYLGFESVKDAKWVSKSRVSYQINIIMRFVHIGYLVVGFIKIVEYIGDDKFIKYK